MPRSHDVNERSTRHVLVSLVEHAIGFLSAPERERVLERLGYTDAELASYFESRHESTLPCLQPWAGDVSAVVRDR